MTAATSISYGKFTVKVGQLNGVWTARAFRRGATNGKGFAYEATGDDEQSAILTLKNKIDDWKRHQREARRYDEWLRFHVPTTDEYIKALEATSLTDAQVSMLRAHADAEAGFTAGELAKAAGYEDFSAANLHYGVCGRALADALEIATPESNHRESGLQTGVLATIGKNRPNGEFVWLIHPELRAAVFHAFGRNNLGRSGLS